MESRRFPALSSAQRRTSNNGKHLMQSNSERAIDRAFPNRLHDSNLIESADRWTPRKDRLWPMRSTQHGWRPARRITSTSVSAIPIHLQSLRSLTAIYLRVIVSFISYSQSLRNMFGRNRAERATQQGRASSEPMFDSVTKVSRSALDCHVLPFCKVIRQSVSPLASSDIFLPIQTTPLFWDLRFSISFILLPLLLTYRRADSHCRGF